MGKWLMAKLLEHYAHILIIVVGFVLVLLMLLIVWPVESAGDADNAEQHTYVTWDTMEYDKFVAVWLIERFVDEDSQIIYYEEGTEIDLFGKAFDVPGAAWSRKHGKCTSDCIVEEFGITDEAVLEIVRYAHRVELNFWQLERWEDTKASFDEVTRMIDESSNICECGFLTEEYFDGLYEEFVNEGSGDDGGS